MTDSADETTYRFERPPRLAPDIDILPPEGPIPLSRLAPERALRRVDRYDRRAVVTGYEVLTSTRTVRITFLVIDDQLFNFEPGQFIGIQADIPSVGVRRSPYCIVSPPNPDRTFQLLIRLVPEGPLSYYLGSRNVGDVIAFRGPSGRLMAPKDGEEDLILLATGVGVGPFLSLVDHLGGRGFNRPVRLLWGLRQTDDICLVDELDDLKRRYPWFGYDISLSQPPRGWTGLRGRITETVPPQLSSLSNKRYYLVGNGAMIEEMATVLSDLGVDRRYIYEEVYFNVRYKADPAVLATIRNRFGPTDLLSPFAQREAEPFALEGRTRRRGDA
ncbi:MAG: ferredoxin--NADP reductase [Acidimicrobiales bacterium]